MLRETEQKYIDKNSKYFIEQTLLNSLSKKELSDFINPLYKEYKEINIKIENKIKEIKNKLKNLDEINIYFIELMVKHNNNGDRLEELKILLNTFNSHLFTRLPNKRYKKELKKIDINSIPIVNVISKYIKLPSNLERNIKCPLHKEKTGSFKIYKDTNSFYCFGCGKGGNAINFISEIENISTKEAFKRFIDYFNL